MLARNLNIPEIKFMPFKGKGSKPTQVPRKTIPAALTAYLSERNTTIDWLFRAQSILNFSKSTLYLGIALLDKLLTLKMSLNAQNCELVGGTILLIVTKFNEVYPVTVKKLNALSNIDNSTQKYVDVEAKILDIVNFDLSPEDPIYQELAELEHRLGGKSQEIMKLAVHNPATSFKLGSPALLLAIESLFTGGLNERKNENKVSIESMELRNQLQKLRSNSSSIRRMVSPSRA